MLMEKASDGIVITDLEGRFEDVNPRPARSWATRATRLIGKSVVEFISPQELARQPLHFDELLLGSRR
jgi:PAS domain S-box-containing protein